MKWPLEVVYWRDTWFSADGDDKHEDYIMRTVGWVDEEGSTVYHLRIVGERQPYGDGERAVTWVSRADVVRRESYSADR